MDVSQTIEHFEIFEKVYLLLPVRTRARIKFGLTRDFTTPWFDLNFTSLILFQF